MTTTPCVQEDPPFEMQIENPAKTALCAGRGAEKHQEPASSLLPTHREHQRFPVKYYYLNE